MNCLNIKKKTSILLYGKSKTNLSFYVILDDVSFFEYDIKHKGLLKRISVVKSLVSFYPNYLVTLRIYAIKS